MQKISSRNDGLCLFTKYVDIGRNHSKMIIISEERSMKESPFKTPLVSLSPPYGVNTSRKAFNQSVGSVVRTNNISIIYH